MTKLIAPFLRFAGVGVLGFVVDSAVLYAGLAVGLTLYSGRAVSWFAAATFNWYLNRRLTFASKDTAVVREWARFLLANAVGGAVNMGTYAVLVANWGVMARLPVLAVGVGSIAGLVFNFALSWTVVFSRGKHA